jgi:hypothetical protein
VPVISRQVWNLCVISCQYAGTEKGQRRDNVAVGSAM